MSNNLGRGRRELRRAQGNINACAALMHLDAWHIILDKSTIKHGRLL